MKSIENIVKINHELSKEILELSVWLSSKETIEYNNYIEQGGNARTAKDKILVELKVKDTGSWNEKEMLHDTLKVNQKTVQHIISIVKLLIESDNTKVAEAFCNNMFDEFSWLQA